MKSKVIFTGLFSLLLLAGCQPNQTTTPSSTTNQSSETTVTSTNKTEESSTTAASTDSSSSLILKFLRIARLNYSKTNTQMQPSLA